MALRPLLGRSLLSGGPSVSQPRLAPALTSAASKALSSRILLTDQGRCPLLSRSTAQHRTGKLPEWHVRSAFWAATASILSHSDPVHSECLGKPVYKLPQKENHLLFSKKYPNKETLQRLRCLTSLPCNLSLS